VVANVVDDLRKDYLRGVLTDNEYFMSLVFAMKFPDCETIVSSLDHPEQRAKFRSWVADRPAVDSIVMGLGLLRGEWVAKMQQYLKEHP
jgi:hypothetical protein